VLLGLLLVRSGWTPFVNPQNSWKRELVSGLFVIAVGLILMLSRADGHIPYGCYWILVLFGALCLWRRLEYWTEERLREFAARPNDILMDRLLRF
jgi:hypothetical protein